MGLVNTCATGCLRHIYLNTVSDIPEYPPRINCLANNNVVGISFGNSRYAVKIQPHKTIHYHSLLLVASPAILYDENRRIIKTTRKSIPDIYPELSGGRHSFLTSAISLYYR
ncbi:hypothetical protein WH835_24795 [Raoultella planticola]|uniref:hypothetical protein n=1 Tax=Raoultella planticola TaxID=575 RepID=UPI00339C6492